MTVKHRTWHTLAEPKYGKPMKILVWTNGDFEGFGHEVTINPKYLRSWNNVLNFLTVVLQPRFGAVRKLYHLETRKMVDCLHNIKSDDRFIAVGGEKVRFRKNGYFTEEERQEASRGKPSKQSIQIVENVKSILNFIAYTKKKNRTVIYVMVSGRTCQEPLKVVLTAADLLVWNMVLEYLAYQLDVAEGVEYLCKTNGKTIFRPSEIQHGEVYVAVPFNNRFVKLDYLKLFSELRPPKKINVRNPRKSHSTSVFQTKKKHRKKKPISPSLATFAGSVVLPTQAKCLSIKCLHDECRLASGPRGNSTAEVQTVISTASVKSHQPLTDNYFWIREADNKKVDNLDTNSEVYESHHGEEAEEASAHSEEDDEEEEATSEESSSEMDLIKSILEEIVEHCVAELEHIGIITRPRSISIDSIRKVDKVFVPDPIERKSREFEYFPGKHTLADCCSGVMKPINIKDKERSLTTFAEIAQNKQRQEIPLLASKGISQTSITDSEGYVKSVSFSQSVLPLQHQEIIYEVDEPILSNVDITNLPAKAPKSSILKSKPSVHVKQPSCFKSFGHPDNDEMRPKFKLTVHTNEETEPHSDTDSEQEDEEESQTKLQSNVPTNEEREQIHGDSDEEEEKIQNMYESFKRSSSFSKRPRDSIMVTVSRLSKHVASTQKNLEDSGENDKSVQAFEEDAGRASQAAHKKKNGKSSLFLDSRNRDESNKEYHGGRHFSSVAHDYSDIYENFDPRTDSIESAEENTFHSSHKQSKFENEKKSHSSSCCDSDNRTISGNQQDITRTSNNDLNKTKTKSQQNTRTSDNSHGSMSKSNQGMSNNGNIFHNDDDIELNIASENTYYTESRQGNLNSIEKTKSSNISNVGQDIGTRTSSLKVVNVGCLRENCASFSCSEIYLEDSESEIQQ